MRLTSRMIVASADHLPRISDEEGPEMHHIVHDPNGPDLEFDGDLLVAEYQADIGKVEVYQTNAGVLVAKQFRAPLYGRTEIDRVGTFETPDDLKQWVGNSTGAKKVMAALGHPIRKKIA